MAWVDGRGAAVATVDAVSVATAIPANHLRIAPRIGPPAQPAAGRVGFSASYGVIAKFQVPQPDPNREPGSTTHSLTVHTREVPVGGLGSGVAPA